MILFKLWITIQPREHVAHVRDDGLNYFVGRAAFDGSVAIFRLEALGYMIRPLVL
jgi:hypothetical protein